MIAGRRCAAIVRKASLGAHAAEGLANVLSPGHRVTFSVMKSGNLVLDLMHVLKAMFVCVLSAGNFVLSILEAVWQRPVQTSCLGMLWVAVRDLI